MATNAAVNCPVHGTHGNLSHGKCWYCVQAGMVAPEKKSRVIHVPIPKGDNNLEAREAKLRNARRIG